MTEIIGEKKWTSVRQLETHELARGGVNGNMNEQAKALADRTEFLKEHSATKDDLANVAGGNYGFNTLAEFETIKDSIPANCVVNIAEAGAYQGDNIWDGTKLTKSPYDPLQIAKNDATEKATNAEKNSKSYTDDSINIPVQITQLLADKSAGIEQLIAGQVSLPHNGSSAAISVYILASPITAETIVNKFSVVSNLATGGIELRVYSKVNNTFSMQRKITTLNVSKIGLNEFNYQDFSPFTVNTGEYLAVVPLLPGVMNYSPAGTSDIYYSNGSTSTDPFTPTAAGKVIIKCAFYFVDTVSQAEQFIDYLEKISNESVDVFNNIFTESFEQKGLSSLPSAKVGVNNGVAHMCLGQAITGFGHINRIDVYSAVAGSAQVGVYTKDGTTFSRKRYQNVVLSVGLNSLNLNLSVDNGDYIGLKTSVAGQVEYENNTNGHEGMFVSKAGFSNDVFTSSTEIPLTTFAYQIRFGLILKSLNFANVKKWLGKKVPFFGDSITWQHLRVFGAGKAEEGLMCYGYQFEISESLGCIVDNKGESGWTMPSICKDRILKYDFSNAYAATITSGANDHKNGVLIGSIKAIGSTFDANTFVGALQTSIEYIISSNPDCKIFLITPIKGWYSQATADAIPASSPFKGQTLLSVEYANAIKAVGTLYSLPVIDWYSEVGINDLNKYEFLADDPVLVPQYLLHPKNKGYRKMGELLLSVMEKF